MTLPFRLLAALVFLAGCAPQPVYRLHAADANAGRWDAGHHLRTARSGGLTADLAYLRSVDGDHVFWVRVANESADTVLVDPARFSVVALVLDSFPGDTATVAGNVRDPEAELLDVDLAASRADARAQERLGSALVGSALATAATLADSPDSPEEWIEADVAASVAQDEVRSAAADGREEAALQASTRAYWEEALRRTTLPPGTYAEGRVHVVADPNARSVEVVVEVGGAALAFPFLQLTYRP